MQINRCPKCGREPSMIKIKSITNYGVEVECYDCGLHSGCCDTKEEAIKKWNELTKGDNKQND